MATVLSPSFCGPDSRTQNLNALHARFAGPLKRFFRGYRLSTPDAEDLTQDVFVRLARSGAQAELRKPASFVFTLARNLVRDRARRLHIKALSKSVTVDTVNLSCGQPTPDQCLELEQCIEWADERLSGLKPATREAFLMHRVDGESHAQIATNMRISVSMVEKHIMAAAACLRERQSTELSMRRF